MKICRVCNEQKPLSDFYKRRESCDGHCHECKKCLGIRTSKDQKENPEGRRAKVNRWIVANKPKLLESRRANYPKWKEYYVEKGREHRKVRPHLHRARIARRRAAKLRATPPWVDHEAIKEIYEKAAAAGMQVDHIHPLQGKNFCGLHVPWNLQPLTPVENQRKGNKLQQER